MQPRGERPKKFVIRGLPRDIPIAEIKSAVSAYGHRVIRVAQMRKIRSKEFMHFFLVTLENAPNFQDAMGIKELIGFEIKMESHRNTSTPHVYVYLLLAANPYFLVDFGNSGEKEIFVTGLPMHILPSSLYYRYRVILVFIL